MMFFDRIKYKQLMNYFTVWKPTRQFDRTRRGMSITDVHNRMQRYRTNELYEEQQIPETMQVGMITKLEAAIIDVIRYSKYAEIFLKYVGIRSLDGLEIDQPVTYHPLNNLHITEEGTSLQIMSIKWIT